MTWLYFELNEPKERIEQYQQMLKEYAEACDASVQFLIRAMELMNVTLPHDGKYAPGVIFILARHAAEQFDATSVLIGMGCVDPCKQHLRSALEASLGIQFILEADTENRALAYHIAEFHRRLNLYRKLDASDSAGITGRTTIKGDANGEAILSSVPQAEIQLSIKNLETGLQKEPHQSVEIEWQKIKKANGRDPPWYAMFGGHRSIRKLAYHLKKAFWYEFIYGDWSDLTHAGSGLKQVGKATTDPNGDVKAIKPLRHPDGLGTICSMLSGMAMEIEHALSEKFLGPVSKNVMKDYYVAHVRPKIQRMQQIKISADWK